MSRRFLVLLLAVAVAATSPVSAQSLTTFAATGPKDGPQSYMASTFHLLSTDPSMLALVQFNVLGTNSPAAIAVDFRTGLVLPPADISPANPYYLSLDGGAVLGGGNLSSDALASYFGFGTGGLPAQPGAPSGTVPTLAVTMTPSMDGKAGVLSYLTTDADGSVLGGSTLAIPADGWWVLGLGAIMQTIPDPQPDDSFPSTADPTATPTPDTGTDAPPQVPEPATLLLAGIGLAGAALTRRVRRVN